MSARPSTVRRHGGTSLQEAKRPGASVCLKLACAQLPSSISPRVSLGDTLCGCRALRACVCVCGRECACVFRRWRFPQPRSNSVVTQSPCERFPASALPPVHAASLWPAEWLSVSDRGWLIPSRAPPPAPTATHTQRAAKLSGLLYFVNRRGDVHSHACCLHPVRRPSWHLIPVIEQLLHCCVSACLLERERERVGRAGVYVLSAFYSNWVEIGFFFLSFFFF